MAGLERLRLSSKRTEASSLLAVESPALLSQLDATGAWWICHDEGDIDAMVSLVVARDDAWVVESIAFERGEGERTDAEALARLGDTIFVFGSHFTDKSGSFDPRRAFVARFSEASAAAGSTHLEVLDLGAGFAGLAASAVAGTELLPSETAVDLVNIEGAGFVGDDLFLGLRWPVSTDGQPLLIRIAEAAPALRAADWTPAAIEALEASVTVVEVGATPKRPAGVRGLTVVDGAVHLVIGQTERDLADKKVKAAASRHVEVQHLRTAHSGVTEIEQFEGFRKVEGVAPGLDGGWLYALDDEDAVVLVLSTES